jgi:hypothetical protein
MEAASAGEMQTSYKSLEYFVAQDGVIKAFSTNLAASVWPDSLRLFIDNL